MREIPQDVLTAIQNRNFTGPYTPRAEVTFLDKTVGENTLPCDRVQINKDRITFAQRCILQIPNVNPSDIKDFGYYSPDRSTSEGLVGNDWQGQILPGKRIQVKLGYGQHMVEVFTGVIDDVGLDTQPGECHIAIDARDMAAVLLDTTITNEQGEYWLEYYDKEVSEIVRDVLLRAGFTENDIDVENTGIFLPEMSFDDITYADCIEHMLTISGFEFLVDDYGKLTFKQPYGRQPEKVDEPVVLSGTRQVILSKGLVIADSYRVYSEPESTGTLYFKDVDYIVNLEHNTIERTVNSSIPDNSTVYVTYVHAAHSFRQGKDLLALPFEYSRRGMYGKVIIEGDGVSATYLLPNPESKGIPVNKILKYRNPYLETEEQCREAANRLGNEMSRKFRKVQFQAVGIPWLQMGDCIQVVESSTTVSEIYRIVDMSFTLGANGLLTMKGSAYYFGYTPLT